METTGRLPPVSRKKARLDPIKQDVFRRTNTGFGVSDNQNKAIQLLLDENERLKKELDEARKEIFQLKEENLELKKQARPMTSSGKTTFVTSNKSVMKNNGSIEESKIDENTVICHNWNAPIAKQNYNLHVIYWEKNLTEWSYWKMKLNKADLDSHIEEERGSYGDLLEAVVKNKISDIETMYEHGNDIHVLSESDAAENSLLHIAAIHGNKEVAEFLIKSGINTNIKNKNNETPLHHVVALKDEQKAWEIIEIMMLHHANPNSKDSLGDTPITKARRSGKSNVMLMFTQNDDRIPTPSINFRL